MQWDELGLDTDQDGGLGAGRIAGKALAGGEPSRVLDPADGSLVADVGWLSASAVDPAVRASVDAQQEWGATDPRDRAQALRAVANDLRQLAEPLGDLICSESGKRLEEARGEVLFSARYFDWFADAATRLESRFYQTSARRFIVDQAPVGVVAAVSPWNFPLSIPARKVAPALAAGCGVVQKPSEITPLSTLALTVVCEKHLPPGLVNTLLGTGPELTTALIDHPGVGAITFTGSTEVGRTVAERCGRTFTHAVLELGGRAPFIVAEDADLDTAVESLMVAKLRNNGESCLAANNIFIHASRYGEVMDQLHARLATLSIGDPRDPGTDLGPLIRPDEVARMSSLVAGSKRDGAETSTYGNLPETGWYAPASVLEGTPPSTDAWTTELFGPVFSIQSFTDEAAVVEEVNGWRTGLGGYVISDDTEHQLSLARALDVGIVGINNGAPNTPEVPFGGRDESGLGREGGFSGLLEFTQEQTLSTSR